jgi:hypothetical protein
MILDERMLSNRPCDMLRSGMNPALVRVAMGPPGLQPLFTVGHAILEFGLFAKLLKDCGIGLVAQEY